MTVPMHCQGNVGKQRWHANVTVTVIQRSGSEHPVVVYLRVSTDANSNQTE